MNESSDVGATVEREPETAPGSNAATASDRDASSANPEASTPEDPYAELRNQPGGSREKWFLLIALAVLILFFAVLLIGPHVPAIAHD